MVDVDIITKKLGELSQRVKRIRACRRESAEELAADQDAMELVSFNLLLAVQACLDLASHLIADEEWEPAASLGDSFFRLQQYGVLSPETARAMKDAAAMRNLIAHGYSKVDPEEVFEAAVNGTADLERFGRELGAWTNRRLAG
jgi:uncharacterized protein YutE (UPF0331/DUF86 family)